MYTVQKQWTTTVSYVKSFQVKMDNSGGEISELLPLIEKNQKFIQQPRHNIYRNLSNDKIGKLIISGFPKMMIIT